jgi:hypothetical protein
MALKPTELAAGSACNSRTVLHKNESLKKAEASGRWSLGETKALEERGNRTTNRRCLHQIGRAKFEALGTTVQIQLPQR